MGLCSPIEKMNIIGASILMGVGFGTINQISMLQQDKDLYTSSVNIKNRFLRAFVYEICSSNYISHIFGGIMTYSIAKRPLEIAPPTIEECIRRKNLLFQAGPYTGNEHLKWRISPKMTARQVYPLILMQNLIISCVAYIIGQTKGPSYIEEKRVVSTENKQYLATIRVPISQNNRVEDAIEAQRKTLSSFRFHGWAIAPALIAAYRRNNFQVVILANSLGK
ncbi:MAG: hypothetical protein ACOYK9_04285 [Chlamydiia bacterium]